MNLQRATIGMGCAGLVLLSVAYCLPKHPSAGGASFLDVVLHILLFVGVGLWFGWFAGRGARVFVPLILLALLLEALQWYIGGYPRIEWGDVVSNEAGLGCAWILLRPLDRRRMAAAARAAAPTPPH